jgi:hypothetical protein
LPAQFIVDGRQLLNAVAQFYFNIRQAQCLAQFLIGGDMNAGDLAAAQIKWDPVGFTVIKCG